MKKICILLFAGCFAAGIFMLANQNRGHVQYVAQCEFECRRADSNCTERANSVMDGWHIKELLEAYKRECAPDVLAKTYSHRSPSATEDEISISNAFSTCSFAIANPDVSKVVVTVYSCDSGIAKDVACFVVKSFAEWMEKRNRQILEKNTARLRVEAEKARRSGRPVPVRISELLSEVESRMRREVFRIVTNGEVRCEKAK